MKLSVKPQVELMLHLKLLLQQVDLLLEVEVVAAGAENVVEEVTYTPGIFQNVTSGNTATGKGWVDIDVEAP